MVEETFPAHYGRQVQIEICPDCDGLWFDRMESLALTPAAVLQLSYDLHERHGGERRPLAPTLRCARCASPLQRSVRKVKTGDYQVWACKDLTHGHFISFYGFLREKGLLVALSGAKLDELRRAVKQVSCSNCGAPVDVQRKDACDHCAAPLALLDVDAMTANLDKLRAEAERKANVVPELVAIDAALQKLRTERAFSAMDLDAVPRGLGSPLNLLEWGLGRLFTKRVRR